MKKLKIGDTVSCEVTGITKYGVFVKLENGYDGLVHISEISKKFVNNIERLYIEGDIIEAKIIEIDEEKKQIKLSIKDIATKLKKKKGLEEKGDGFLPLKENLDIWVKEKLEELQKKSKTP
jgi:general stress protein 13